MPIEVVTSPVPRKRHHPSCISSNTHRMLCMPLSLLDCTAHDPGNGVTCYTRPEFEVSRPADMPGVQPTVNYACVKHLGEVVLSTMPPASDPFGDDVTVKRYEGA